MKKRIFTSVALVGCFMFCLAAVADLNGKWIGTLATPGGDYPISYTFKVVGDSLKGSGVSPDGEIAITGGKITGSDFSFALPYNGTDIKNTGKFYPVGDSVALDVDFNGSKMHATLKRSDK